MRNVSGETLNAEQTADLLELNRVEKEVVMGGIRARWLSGDAGSVILVQGSDDQALVLR